MEVFRLRTDGLTWREIEGEVVALHLPTSRYVSTNPAGTRLWHLLESGVTRGDLVGELIDTYGIEGARAEHDVDNFLASLVKHGLVDS